MSKESITLPDSTVYKIKRDLFRKTRGGTSTMLEISCSDCDTDVMIYQKDGSGALMRCYLDRIAWPPDLSKLESETDKNKVPDLKCNNCNNHMGTAMVYSPESRLAFRLIPGKFKKRKFSN